MNSNYIKHTQSDGLRIILVPDSSKDVVTTMVLIGTGSRYEREEIAGISHILEHMFYKGTKKRPSPAEISGFIEGIGGEFNAFTSKEYTGFYTKVAQKHLAKSIDFLSDLLISPLFQENDLEKEKQVILQEYDMYEDLPMEVASSKFEEALFGKNSLGRDVIGYRDSISGVGRESLVKYWKDHYRSSNTVLVIAGNISSLSETQLFSLIEDSFRFPKGDEQIYQKIALPSEKQLKLITKKTEQTHIVLGFRGVSYNSQERFGLRLLAMILGGSMSSRMFSEIREKRGLAYAVRTTAGNYLDTGMVDTYAGVPHEKAEEAIRAILEEYGKISKGVTPGEFSRAKEIIYGRMLISFEDTNQLANHYALNELLLSKVITPPELAAEYQKIKPGDILEIHKRYFKENGMALSVVGPLIKESDLKFFSFSQ
jgi:predicted Zn-dependent peptidase